MLYIQSLNYTNRPAQCSYCISNNNKQCMVDDKLIDVLNTMKILNNNSYNRFIRRQTLSAMPIDDIVYCPNIKCQMPSIENNTIVSNRVVCDYCNTVMCQQHGIKWHNNQTCVEYDNIQSGNDTATVNMLKQTSKQCPKCKYLTTHYKHHGCHSILYVSTV